MSETKTSPYYLLHDDYAVITFVDGMTKEDLQLIYEVADSVAKSKVAEGKPILVLVDVSQRTKLDMGLFKDKVHLLDIEGITAVAIYGEKDGPIHSLVSSVVSSFSSVTPIKFFSDKNEAVDWLRTSH